MLVNNPKKMSDIEKFINESKFEFFLTGSRFFGNATNTSDYDYFVEYSMSLLKDLHTLGFSNESSNRNYTDISLDRLLKKDGIHIQIIHPEWMQAKIKAQNVLAHYRKYLLCTKEQRKLLWDVALLASK